MMIKYYIFDFEDNYLIRPTKIILGINIAKILMESGYIDKEKVELKFLLGYEVDIDYKNKIRIALEFITDYRLKE